MEEGDAQRLGVLLQRTRQKTAHHRALGQKRGVCARRQVRAMAHDRPDVAHVDLPHGEVALPSHHVDGVERVDHFGNLVVRLDPHLPLAVVVEMRRGLRRRDYARVVQRVVADQPLVRLIELTPRLDDQEEIVLGLGNQPVRYRARQPR